MITYTQVQKPLKHGCEYRQPESDARSWKVVKYQNAIKKLFIGFYRKQEYSIIFSCKIKNFGSIYADRSTDGKSH